MKEKMKRWCYFKAAYLLKSLIVWLYKPYSYIKSCGADLGYWEPGVVNPILAEMFNRDIPFTGRMKLVNSMFEEGVPFEEYKAVMKEVEEKRNGK